MKKLMKKLIAGIAAVTMVLGMALPVMAQEVSQTVPSKDNATITINNPAKGETYSIFKLFDATYNSTTQTIAYQTTGNIPAGLTDYFEKDTANTVKALNAAWKDPSAAQKEMSEGLQNALSTWATSATAIATTPEDGSDGSTLKFTGLSYGYYVVTTSHGESETAKAAITVDSTTPDASIYDKNSTTPVSGQSKKAYASATDTEEKTDFSIGDTVYYKVSFNTSNYSGSGASAKQITKYVITDTLPDFLTNIHVDSVTIGGANYTVGTPAGAPQFENNQITIPWVDGQNNLYADGAEVVITYHATLSNSAAVAGDGNRNTVTITPYNGETADGGSEETVENTIYTYALALKKVNKSGEGLGGATFKLPFYVVENEDGTYTHESDNTVTNAINSVTTPADGVIIIKGVAAGDYSITETEAPKGYNKLTSPFIATAVPSAEKSTSTKVFLDKDGKVVKTEQSDGTTVEYSNDNIAASVVPVLNLTGGELPSTGGMGTTIFYALGAALAIGAGVILVTRKRLSK